MSVNNTDYSNLWNQQKLNNTSNLLGNNAMIGGLSGDMINQWAMRGANAAAYRKLLQAQELGTVKQNKNYTDLMSDKYFNDNFNAETGKITKPTYKPDASNNPTIDSKATPGEHLDNMRHLALAAINNPDGLNSTHYDLFEQMRQAIANNLVKGSSTSSGTEITKEEAAPATLTKTADFHLLTDDQNITVAGAKGEKNYSFGTGDSLQSVVAAINADSAETGVKAEWKKNDDGTFAITLNSTETGKDAVVRVDQNVGNLFADAGKSVSAKGKDAVTEEAETVATGDDTQAAIAAGVYTGKLFSDQTFTIAGTKGSQQFSFAAGTSVEDVVSAINAASEKLGVTAEIIRNADGETEAIGLLAAKAGSGQYVQVTQDKGDLFAAEGKSIKVSGSSVKSSGDGPAIDNTSDLGRVTIDGKTYSFADLGPGGSASLANNPDAALAVLDQTLKDIYEGRAEVKGFDPGATYIPNVSDSTVPNASTNALEIGNWGSDALSKWINQYLKTDD